MTSLAQHILTKANQLPEGGVFSPKEFLHLGSRDAVDQTFTRLLKENKLLRVGRGLYTLPLQGRFGSRPPSPERLLAALTEKTGETVVSHGAAAANRLGLTTQVPVREIFLTSGRSRTLRLGSRVLEIKHAPHWQLLLGESSGGALLRALAWLGPEQAEEVMPQVHEMIPAQEWEAVAAVRSELPSWLAKTVSRVEQHA
ncbi:type IV toxin-antitoxin system AbiEi family antitoxin domain-containing protein [Desulfovibrio sp. OttesenSCG-928-A18]|nr:type IV toxin-antitoxin system AbiEi family antitoxin domain-containing protein [Desulfovibrio sp. OttesenSCG-928-A18]